jgi:hypothetical protein
MIFPEPYPGNFEFAARIHEFAMRAKRLRQAFQRFPVGFFQPLQQRKAPHRSGAVLRIRRKNLYATPSPSADSCRAQPGR